ncbi:hypothetical protein AKO1_013713 [Acrasis kona]|uniref:EF-hand domain-containing protein n=1 Tax=Acrasis kona TaxID=1008807 RepID=A0AAW2ZIL0_9EUKA
MQQGYGQQGGYPQSGQQGYGQQGGYPQSGQQGGYSQSNQQGGYPQSGQNYQGGQQGGYPQQQGGQQGGYPNTSGGAYPQSGGAYPQSGGAYQQGNQQSGGQGPYQTYQGQYATYGQQYSAPPQNVDPNIANWFNQVDSDRSGLVSTRELVTALSTGGFQQFSTEAAENMIRMFSGNGSGQLTLNEFQHLVQYLNQMRTSFQQLDTNRSNCLDYNEVQRALTTSGYNFDPRLLPKIMANFDKNKTGSLTFDEYLDLAIFMGSARDVFRGNDYNRTGTVTLGFDQFLSAALALRFGAKN